MLPIGATLLSLLAQAVPASPPDRLTPAGEQPGYYGCAFMRDIGRARLSISARVGLDGRPLEFTAVMWGSEGRLGLWRQVTWGGATFDAMTGNASIILQHFQRRQFMGRIELRRAVDGANALVAAGEPLFSNQHSLWLRWNQIDSVARAPGGLIARVAGHDGRAVREGRLDAAAYDLALAAVRVERARLEAMIADYRTRCAPMREDEVVVT